MSDINFWAVVVAALAAVAVGGLWYGLLFHKPYLKLRVVYPGAPADGKPSPVEVLGDIVRYLITATAIAYLFVQLDVNDWQTALGYGALLWFGFQTMLLFGFLLHEKTPLKIHLIHSSDALASMLLMSVILGTWR